jgi:hypothetical protein
MYVVRGSIDSLGAMRALSDGTIVYEWVRFRTVGDVRIWRNRERGNFDASEIDILKLVEPAITAALSRLNWHDASPVIEQRESAESTLQREGRLSRREAQVACW